MSTININRDLISKVNTYPNSNNPVYIVVHETDNVAVGAGAQRHAQAQKNGNLSTSVHYYAGSDGVYQTAEHCDGTFSIGKEYGGNHSIKNATNRNSINIEICVNADGDYNVARQNAIELVKYLIQTTGIPAERVVRHYDVKGKYCPRKMLDTPALWEDFKAQIGVANVSQTPVERVQEIVTGTVITKQDPLVLRDAPNGNKMTTIPKGATVVVLEQGSSWHKVSFNGLIGYSAAKYIALNVNTNNGGYVGKCTGNGVRVRSTPDFGDNVLRKLNKDNLFDVLGVEGVWTHINVAGQEGYIYSEYVARA